MKKLLFILCILPSLCFAANDDISDRPELGTAVNTDSILAVNAGNTAGDRLSRILFTGAGTKVLAGNGLWLAYCGEPTADNQIQQATGVGTCAWTSTLEGIIDDTKGNGDTTYIWSADKVFDQLALKQGADTDLDTYATLPPSANFQTLSGHTFAQMRGDLDLEADTDFAAYGKLPVVIASKATDYTLGTDSANEAFGGTVYVTGVATITVPAIAVGQNYCVVTIGDIAVSLDVNAADKMILDGVTLADGDKATNSSKSGDTICCQYYSADGQYCWSGTVLGGHWTDGN